MGGGGRTVFRVNVNRFVFSSIYKTRAIDVARDEIYTSDLPPPRDPRGDPSQVKHTRRKRSRHRRHRNSFLIAPGRRAVNNFDALPSSSSSSSSPGVISAAVTITAISCTRAVIFALNAAVCHENKKSTTTRRVISQTYTYTPNTNTHTHSPRQETSSSVVGFFFFCGLRNRREAFYYY